MSDAKKVSTITWIAILVKRFNKFEDEFHKVFKRPLNDYWVSLVGLKVGKLADDFLNKGKPFEQEVRVEYGDEVWDMLSQLLMLDYEIDKTIEEDVTWDSDSLKKR